MPLPLSSTGEDALDAMRYAIQEMVAAQREAIFGLYEVPVGMSYEDKANPNCGSW